jgi:hypothetical protein
VAQNRSFKRDSKGNLVSEVSKRERSRWKYLWFQLKKYLTNKVSSLYSMCR